jgi:hypothetical protein
LTGIVPSKSTSDNDVFELVGRNRPNKSIPTDHWTCGVAVATIFGVETLDVH